MQGLVEHNYYQLMGLELYADFALVKKKYRELALLYHPDRNPDDKSAEEYFKVLTQGYNLLSEPDQKLIYDNILRNSFRNSSLETVVEWQRKQKESVQERLRQHKERHRQNIIRKYEKDEEALSHKLRYLIALLVYISGILFAYNNWFLNMLDFKVIYIVVGAFMFGLGSYLIADNLYKRRLYRIALNQREPGVLRGPVRLFTVLFLVTPLVFLIGTHFSKVVQLKYFYDITTVDQVIESREMVTYQYHVDGVEIARRIDYLPESNDFPLSMDKRHLAYRVKYSRINPIISELITVEEANSLK